MTDAMGSWDDEKVLNPDVRASGIALLKGIVARLEDGATASTAPFVKITDGTNDVVVNSEGQMHVVLMGKISDGNSSSTPLVADAVFTGTAVNILDFGFIFVTVFSDVVSATDGLSVQQSSDGINWDNTDVYTIPAGTGKTYSFQPASKWLRIVYTNGGTDQTDFRLQTLFKKTSSLPSSHRISDNLSPEDDASLNIAVIKGQKPNGDYTDFNATAGGNFKVSIEEFDEDVSLPAGNNNIGDVDIRFADSEILDAFGRARVSQPFNTFDMQFNYDLQTIFFEELATGAGDVTHVANSSAARLTTGGVTSGDGVVFQTQQYFRYQPGKSTFIVFTCILGAKISNARKRIGNFDADNGFFFEQDGSNLKVVRRTKTSGSVVDNVVNQSAWNLDVLDGSGNSGITLDESKDNIFVIDFQALYAGRIRYGFDFGGQITYCHQIKFANTEAVPFIVNANLPFRAEIFNTAVAAGATTFDFTCASVASEGGFNPLGVRHSANTGSTGETLTTIEPVLSLRPKTTFNSITNRGQILPLEVNVLSTAEPVLVELLYKPSLTGASFASVDSDSTAEFDVAATSFTGGHVVSSFHVPAASQGAKLVPDAASKSIFSKQTLNLDIAGTTADILTIAVTSLTGAATDVYAAVDWLELR